VIKIIVSAEDEQRLKILKDHLHPIVRRKALIILLKQQGIRHNKIAKSLGRCVNTITTHLKGYKILGIKYIEAIHSYKPRGKLTSFDSVVRNYFENTPPSTIKQACLEISELTGITIKETQMRHHLKGMKIRYRKVCSIPAKADVEAQKKFKEEQLEPRLQEARDGKRSVYFVDAAHFVMGAYLGYLWCISRLFVKTAPGRQRFNVLGALNAMTKEVVVITNETYITSIQVCDLIQKLVTHTNSPITIVLDNAKYQRCRLVIAQAASLNVEFLFLPPYSPNLNLIERLWKFTKKHCLNSQYHSDFSKFKAAITTFLGNMNTTHQEALESLLTLNFQVFNPESLKKAA